MIYLLSLGMCHLLSDLLENYNLSYSSSFSNNLLNNRSYAILILSCLGKSLASFIALSIHFTANGHTEQRLELTQSPSRSIILCKSSSSDFIQSIYYIIQNQIFIGVDFLVK